MEYVDLLPNLASNQLGSEVLFATDEWFASAGKIPFALHKTLILALIYFTWSFQIIY